MAEYGSGAPIAIVGMGCVLPDAIGPEAFWKNVLAGHSAIRPLGGPTWQWERYFDPDPAAPDRTYTILGARVENYTFDWRRFRIPPSEAQAINPMQLMILDAGAQALEGVRVLPKETTGLIIGSTGLGWQRDSGLRIRMGELCEAVQTSPEFARLPVDRQEAILAATRRSLEARLKPVSEDNVVNAAASVAAGRIAMHFDLRGMHYAIDAGFASSLAALDVGVRLLRDHTLDLVLVGGASELLTPLELVAFAKLGGLAKTRVAPFDARAEGTLLGEGVAMFALKRLEDAVRDGETIHAVVLGVGGSTDGRDKALCAPHPDGQALAMRRAYQDAGIDPGTVGFVECHATGTQVGDVSEVRALASVFGHVRDTRVALGSAKPFVGHLRAGAGAVGLLRAVLALRHGIVPRQIQFETPNPAMNLDATPFVIPREAMPLRAVGGASVPRVAVSAFGFGGNNFHAVLEGYEDRRRLVVAVRSRPEPEPIAIVGMGGMFPGADNVDAFWQSLLEGRDATREVPSDRWDIRRYYDPDPNRNDTTYTRLGCFLDRLPAVDERLRVPPAAHASVDPSQVLVFLAAEQALNDAGFRPGRWDGDRVMVSLAFLPYQGKKFLADIRVNFREFQIELERALWEAGLDETSVQKVLSESERNFKSKLPPITEDTLTGYLGSINASRIARHFGFRGPHFVVDSACASTHAAVHAAVQALRHRTCDVAVTGGVWSDMMPEFFIAACRFQALSARGSRPFGAGADGFIPGEGAGVFVLRRLSDAERDGQRIHAVIRSVSGSSDGRGRSVLAPRPEGEALAMQRALTDAGVPPESIDYVECHGTGTALGDATEVDACTRAYGQGRSRPLLIGSVKSNIGHLNAAAGAPALIKTALALREGVIPPSLKAEPPNPKIDFMRGPVMVVTRTMPWPACPDRPRRAAVHGFGVGGTNMSLVLEEYRSSRSAVTSPGTESRERRILPIAAAHGPEVAVCIQTLSKLANELRGASEEKFQQTLEETQRRVSTTREGYRVAVVAGSPEELVRKCRVLESVWGRRSEGGFLQTQGIFVGRPDQRIKVAVAFPGQGPQYPNMLREACARFPILADTLATVDRAYETLCGRPLTPAFFVDDTEGYVQRDEDIHCAVFAVNLALFRLMERYGLRPDAVVGQSAGELSALVAARVLSLEDGLAAMRERTLAVLSLQVDDPGKMVALGCAAQDAEKLIEDLPGYCAIAADNSPSACIVSASREAAAMLVDRCARIGIEATVLAVSHGYHSRFIAGARPRYLAKLRTLKFSEPRCDVVSTITGGSIRTLDPRAYPDHLASQYVEPVRLRQAIETLYENGIRLFLECGPKWPLTTFIGQILGTREHVAQATLHPKVGEVEQIHRALACLFVHGVGELQPVEERETKTPSVVLGAVSSSLGNEQETETTKETMSGPTREDILSLLRSIRDTIDEFVRRWEMANADRATTREARTPSVDALSDQGLPKADHSVPAVTPEEPRKMSSGVAHATGSNGPSDRPVVRTSSGDSFERVRSVLLEKMVARTGYPEDMLDLDLDMEADLGIDTVKQVAIISEVRTHFGLSLDPNFKLREHNTLRKVVQYLARRLETETMDGQGGEIDRSSQAEKEGLRTEGSFSEISRSAGPVQQHRPAPPERDSDNTFQRVRSVLLEKMVARTGYPEDMLDLDLDMEADLGIDTVKQVAIISEVRTHFGLSLDPNFKLREHNTLRKVVEYLVRRLAGTNGSVATDAPPAAPRSSSRSPTMVTMVAGSAESAEGPWRTVSTVSIAAGQVGTAPALLNAQRQLVTETRCLQLVLANTAGTVRLERLRVLTPAVIPRNGTISLMVQTLEDATASSRRYRVVSTSEDVHLEVTVGEEPGGSVALRPEIRVALDRRNKPHNGRALLESLGRSTHANVVWARSNSFDEVVGGMRLSKTLEEPVRASAMAAMVEGAFVLAAFGWYALTGAVHTLSGIERVRFYRSLKSDEELLFHVRLVSPMAGAWRADVSVVDGEMKEVVATLEGMSGTRVGEPASAVTSAQRSDGAIAWQHFCRRMRYPLVEGEDHTW